MFERARFLGLFFRVTSPLFPHALSHVFPRYLFLDVSRIIPPRRRIRNRGKRKTETHKGNSRNVESGKRKPETDRNEMQEKSVILQTRNKVMKG